MAHDLDVIRQAIEERDAALQACDDLANEMIYRGNSVAWWHSKATAYRDAIDRCWDALKDAGIHPDGKTDVATAIRQLAERSNALAQADAACGVSPGAMGSAALVNTDEE